MADALDCRLMCYYCTFQSDSGSDCLTHILDRHLEKDVSLRHRELDPESGQLVFRSKHFALPAADVRKRLDEGYRCKIDIPLMKLRFEKPMTHVSGKESAPGGSFPPSAHVDDVAAQSTEDDLEKQSFLEALSDVYLVLKSTGRLDDFLSVLEALSSGRLSTDHILLNLLLDVGQFLRQPTVHNMRYNTTSIQFWVVVKKLFHGKGLRFFKGYKAAGYRKQVSERGPIPTEYCELNFAVPSDETLTKASEMFKTDAMEPGILTECLQSFAEHNQDNDCKLCIDGKKIAVGFGRHLGEENLAGFEEEPNLQQRRERLDSEMRLTNRLQEVLAQTPLEIQFQMLNTDAKQTIKSLLLEMMPVLSERCRELREYSVKHKGTIRNLMKRVNGNWMESDLKGAISFFQTKLLKADASIKNLMQCIDDFGYFIAIINETHQFYVRGQGATLKIGIQGNSKCLREVDADTLSKSAMTESAPKTKQHTEEWKNLRSEARVTGSTLNNALGLRTLREQQEHHDYVHKGKKRLVSDELQARFDHGTRNEPNALATLLGKIMPVYFPDMMYHEDGCEVMTMSEGYAVISGDGTLKNDHDNKRNVAVELKCPVPGKLFATDVYYKFPRYYSTQVLSQMAAKECNTFLNVCYTPQSSTFFLGKFDSGVWQEVWEYANTLYGQVTPRPTRRSEESKQLEKCMHKYAESAQFVAEFPSLSGELCHCEKTPSLENAHGSHANTDQGAQVTVQLDDCATAVQAAADALQEAYNLLRKPAKEVLVAMVSDLERNYDPKEDLPHAVPIAYYLPGYSLKMSTIRPLIHNLIAECRTNAIPVKAVAFDGQFLELSTTDPTGKPLTLTKLHKEVWQSAVSVDKQKQISFIFNMNNVGRCDAQTLETHINVHREENGALRVSLKGGYATVRLPKHFAKYTQKSSKSSAPTETGEQKDQQEAEVLQQLPDNIVEALSEDSRAAIIQSDQLSELHQQTTQLDPDVLVEDEYAAVDDARSKMYEEALGALRNGPKGSQWTRRSLAEFKQLLGTAESIEKSFVKPELAILLRLVPGASFKTADRKSDMVDKVSKWYGSGNTLKSAAKTPKSLKTLAKEQIKTWPKIATNIVYSSATFPDRLRAWQSQNPFQNGTVISTETGVTFTIPFWYAQPTICEEQMVQFIIDPHHLFVNNRCRCCSKGMPGMGIRSEAWTRVASNEAKNQTGLSLELVKELRDRQSNAYAQTTFSKAVEEVMETNGDRKEAEWCRLLRNWYTAVDGAGISVEQRIQWLMEMRQKLLDFFPVGKFPPPTQYVADLPITQFEGILCNIDRRLQLYATTTTGHYNQRAISSLDCENFFGTFQDMDPSGTGCLRPDDIPQVLGSATCLLKYKLDATRTFPMKITKRKCYVEHPLAKATDTSDHDGIQTDESRLQTSLALNRIEAESSFFDSADRQSKHPRRKTGTLSSYDKPGKGAAGVRAHHKMNEERILAHRRENISDAAVDAALPKEHL